VADHAIAHTVPAVAQSLSLPGDRVDPLRPGARGLEVEAPVVGCRPQLTVGHHHEVVIEAAQGD
jgi:hypothetical protein